MPSSVISSQSMHLGVLATASHAVATRTLFVEFNKPGTSQFIVGLNKYLEAVNNCFGVGMRFKMRFEGEDSPERRFTGTIVGVEDLSSQWENLKWRSLKVQWDDAASIARPERVFPWEIEPFVPFASNKRPRPPPNEVPIHETASAAASAVCIYGKWEELYNPDNHIAVLSVKIWKNLYTFKVELFTLQAMQNGIATGSELIKTNIALNGNELAEEY